MPQSLTEPNRAKLDSIVQRMADAGEPDDAIRFVVSDFKSKYALPDKPVSAEDFLPPERSTGDKAWSVVKGLGRTTLGGLKDLAMAASDLQRGTLGGDLDAMHRTTERAKGLVGAQAGEFGKAREAFVSGRGSEGVGHTLAGLVPLVGPAAAHAGELAETDPYGAAGEAGGLLLGSLAPSLAPHAARGAQTVGRGAQATGRGVASAARSVSPVVGEIAKTGALEAGAHAVGLPPLVLSGARVLLQNAIGRAKAAKAAEAKVPALAMHGPEIEAMLRGSESPPLAAHGPAPSPNFGGTLVRDASGKAVKVPRSFDAALSGALDELAQADAAPSVELPPAAELPPGYEPRSTVPPPRPSVNAGGRLVRDRAPSSETALADVLAELQAETPPARISTPPQPDLPPGYTPRTTAPPPKKTVVSRETTKTTAAKPRAERPDYAKRPSERKPKPSATIGQKNYFLRKDAPAAVERAAPRALTVDDLPDAWKPRTQQPLVKTKPGEMPTIDEVRAMLDETGLTAEEVIDALGRDRTLKTPDRIRLVEAVNQTRRRRAQ